MLKKCLSLIGFCAASLFAAQVQAIAIVGGPLGGTNVGSLDTFLGASTGINGDQAEIDYINMLAGTTFTKSDLQKISDVAYYNTDTADTFASDLSSFGGAGWFLVKNSTWTAVFANLADLNFGVFSSCSSGCQLNSADFNIPTDPFVISHFSATPGGGTGGGSGTIPEPSVVLLFAVGLLCLAFSYRNKAAG